jgi:putative ABC transport system permease protein
MGSNTFNIQRYELTARRQSSRERQKVNPIINYQSMKDFEDNYDFPFTNIGVSYGGTASAEVRYEDKKTDPEIAVFGGNENYIENAGLEITNGRPLNIFDINNGSSVCVIGSDLVKLIFPEVNPVGKTISLRGTKFKVIGVFKSQGSTFGGSVDSRVIIPLQKARSIYPNGNVDYNLSIKVDTKGLLEAAKDEAILTFRNVRGLKPIESNNFGVVQSDDLLVRATQNIDALYVAAWIISIITIFGSTIALMNIMLVSVSERTREIGVRKALGAKSKTIAFQFFMETVIIGQLGGILGILL